MEPQTLTEIENQYTPWVERGETEQAYYQRLYLEVTMQNAELEQERDELREMVDQIADVCFVLLMENCALRRYDTVTTI